MRLTVKIDPTRVWALRTARGYTQKELARAAGLSQAGVQRMETRGDLRYAAVDVRRLAQAIGVALQDLGVSDEDARLVEQAEAAVVDAERPPGHANAASAGQVAEEARLRADLARLTARCAALEKALRDLITRCEAHGARSTWARVETSIRHARAALGAEEPAPPAGGDDG